MIVCDIRLPDVPAVVAAVEWEPAAFAAALYPELVADIKL